MIQGKNQMNQGYIQEGSAISQPLGFKAILNFAKSECPTPKTRMMDNPNLPQNKFYTRKNSNHQIQSVEQV